MDYEFYKFLSDNGYNNIRQISVDRYAAVSPFAFTHAIIIGKIGDKYGYDDRWCYHSLAAAAEALLTWDGKGEPKGWQRHPPSGRRRTEGDPAQEYILA